MKVIVGASGSFISSHPGLQNPGEYASAAVVSALESGLTFAAACVCLCVDILTSDHREDLRVTKAALSGAPVG